MKFQFGKGGPALFLLAYAYAPVEENKKGVCKFSARFLAFSNEISTFQKIVQPRAEDRAIFEDLRLRGQGQGLEASRPRPRTSKCVLEDSTSAYYQRWSRGHKARGQGQGHKKNPRPRPRTAFPRTDTLEAKDRNARGQGQGPRTQSASALQKKKKKGLHKKFSGDLQKKKKKKKRSSQKFFKRSPRKNAFQKIFQPLHKILTFQKIVLSSSRGQANFRGLEASRPRPRTSKSVLEDVLEAKDVLEDSTSAYYSVSMNYTGKSQLSVLI